MEEEVLHGTEETVDTIMACMGRTLVNTDTACMDMEVMAMEAMVMADMEVIWAALLDMVAIMATGTVDMLIHQL